jgi:hypothetical protein
VFAEKLSSFCSSSSACSNERFRFGSSFVLAESDRPKRASSTETIQAFSVFFARFSQVFSASGLPLCRLLIRDRSSEKSSSLLGSCSLDSTWNRKRPNPLICIQAKLGKKVLFFSFLVALPEKKGNPEILETDK